MNFKNLLRQIELHSGDLLFIFATVLLAIWVIPGTIALRNLLIILGCLFGVLFLVKNRVVLISKSAIPAYIFFTIFFWVLCHLFFLGEDYLVQLQELKSLWARCFGGAIIALAVGIYLQLNQFKKRPFLVFFYTTPVFILGFFLLESFKYGNLLDPRNFLELHLKDKINTAFSAVIGVAVCITYLLWNSNNQRSRSTTDKFWFCLLGIILSLMSLVVVSSKNGILISILILSLGIFQWFLLITKNKKINVKNLSKIFFLIIFILIGVKLHLNYAFPGWDNLREDIQIALELEKFQNWKDTPKFGFPVRSDGTTVAVNTYERVAWGSKGIELILKNPLGYGTINESSFRGLLIHDGINYSNKNLTHSGWIDFGLAFGIPGLLIMFSSIFSTLVFSLKKKDFYGLTALWLCIALSTFGLIAEVAFKQSFEVFIFLVAFSCACVIQIPLKNQSELLPIK